MELVSQGAEARIFRCIFLGQETLVKERFAKLYRHPDLDRTLRARQFATELRALLRCSRMGLRVPLVLWADVASCRLFLRREPGLTVRAWLALRASDLGSDECRALARRLGSAVARMHGGGLVHGDLTTSNFLVAPDGEVVCLDFGLSYNSTDEEDFAVDLYVLERAMLSTHPRSEQLFVRILKAYRKAFADPAAGASIVRRLTVVRQRGRKKIAFG